MRKWAEVLEEQQDGKKKYLALVAALDISEETDNGEKVMADKKLAYGASAVYRWHSCDHDEITKGCKVQPA